MIYILCNYINFVQPCSLTRSYAQMIAQSFRFGINVRSDKTTGYEGSSVIPLHMAFYIKTGTLVLNDYQNGWTSHQTEYNGLPIKEGQPFQLTIVCTPDKYVV